MNFSLNIPECLLEEEEKINLGWVRSLELSHQQVNNLPNRIRDLLLTAYRTVNIHVEDLDMIFIPPQPCEPVNVFLVSFLDGDELYVFSNMNGDVANFYRINISGYAYLGQRASVYVASAVLSKLCTPEALGEYLSKRYPCTSACLLRYFLDDCGIDVYFGNGLYWTCLEYTNRHLEELTLRRVECFNYICSLWSERPEYQVQYFEEAHFCNSKCCVCGEDGMASSLCGKMIGVEKLTNNGRMNLCIARNGELGHFVCHDCRNLLQQNTCPLCRAEITRLSQKRSGDEGYICARNMLFPYMYKLMKELNNIEDEQMNLSVSDHQMASLYTAPTIFRTTDFVYLIVEADRHRRTYTRDHRIAMFGYSPLALLDLDFALSMHINGDKSKMMDAIIDYWINDDNPNLGFVDHADNLYMINKSLAYNIYNGEMVVTPNEPWDEQVDLVWDDEV